MQRHRTRDRLPALPAISYEVLGKSLGSLGLLYPIRSSWVLHSMGPEIPTCHRTQASRTTANCHEKLAFPQLSLQSLTS